MSTVIDKGLPPVYRVPLPAVAGRPGWRLAAQARRSAVRSVSSCATFDTVLARMAAPSTTLASGWSVGRWLIRPPTAAGGAVYRYSLDSGDHRTCGADIARGSLRLWSLAGGMLLHRYRKS